MTTWAALGLGFEEMVGGWYTFEGGLRHYTHALWVVLGFHASLTMLMIVLAGAGLGERLTTDYTRTFGREGKGSKGYGGQMQKSWFAVVSVSPQRRCVANGFFNSCVLMRRQRPLGQGQI